MKNLLKDPLFVAFWLYLGKVLYLGLNLYEAIFMASLVGIHVFKEYNTHKEKLKSLEIDSKLESRVAAIENWQDSVNSKVEDASKTAAALSIIKRR